MLPNSRIKFNREAKGQSHTVAPRRWNDDKLASEVVRSVLPQKRRRYSELTKKKEARKPREVSSFRNVLVPVNGEHVGEYALPLALGIANRTGAEIHLVLVHRPYRSDFPFELMAEPGLPDRLRREQKDYLDELVRRIKKVTSVPITPIFLEGNDVAGLLSEYASENADLVVIATQGRGILSRLWSEATAQPLLRRLTIPVLFVRGYDAPVDLTGDPQIQHMLFPVNGSSNEEDVLQSAMALRMQTNTRHTFLQIVPLSMDCPLGQSKLASGQPRSSDLLSEDWKHLDRLSDRLNGGKTNSVRSTVITNDRPIATAIVDYSQSNDVDLIVMSTRNRSGLARFFTGSIADKVIRSASKPVLVCHAEKSHDEDSVEVHQTCNMAGSIESESK